MGRGRPRFGARRPRVVRDRAPRRALGGGLDHRPAGAAALPDRRGRQALRQPAPRPRGRPPAPRLQRRPPGGPRPALRHGARRLRGAAERSAGRRHPAVARLDRLRQASRLPGLRRHAPRAAGSQRAGRAAGRGLVQRLSRLLPAPPAPHLRHRAAVPRPAGARLRRRHVRSARHGRGLAGRPGSARLFRPPQGRALRRAAGRAGLGRAGLRRCRLGAGRHRHRHGGDPARLARSPRCG